MEIKAMFNKKSDFLRLFAAALVSASFCLHASAIRAQQMTEQKSMVFFDEETNSRPAFQEAKRFYKSFMKEKGIKDSEISQYAFARYLSLDDKNSKKFVALFEGDDIRDECPPLGCEITIFETLPDGSAKVVFNAYAHNLWIADSGRDNQPKDIFSRSYYIDPKTNQGGDIYKWEWRGGHYVNSGVYQER